MPRWTLFALGLVAVFGLLQLIPVYPEYPEDMPQEDFLEYARTPDHFEGKIRTSCYPCHSYNSTDPGFLKKIYPFSLWHQQDLQKARQALNFGEWVNYQSGTQYHKMEATVNVLKKGHAPFEQYAKNHAEASWSDMEKQMLIEYFESWRELLR